MGNIPDVVPNKYEKIIYNYQQIRKKLKKLDDAHIDNTNNKELFKEIRDILVDIRQLLKIANGIQKEDDKDAAA